jgi:hypothetical protein
MIAIDPRRADQGAKQKLQKDGKDFLSSLKD